MTCKPDGHTDLAPYLLVPDAALARALAAGADELQPVMEKGDDDRRGGFRSPDGTRFVARQVG